MNRAQRRASKPAAPSETHAHCYHVAGGVFGLHPGPGGQPQVMGVPSVCCRCGAGAVEYVGVVEAGHGPHVKYQLPTAQQIPNLVLPNGGLPH